MIFLVAAVVVGDSNLSLVLSALSSAGIVGAVVALVTLRSTTRKAAAGADQAEADAELADVKIGELRQNLTTQVLASVNAELARYREQIAEERTRAAAAVQGQAEAQSKLAEAQLLLAETLEMASKERHELRNELGAVKAENELLRRQVDELRDEVKSLRAQLDTERHGRRVDDPAS